jgi:hypothetical protein
MKRVALALVALTLATGCGKIREKLAEKAIERSTGGDVKISSGGVTVKDDKNGATTVLGSDAKLPDGWPSSIPVYTGAKLSASMVTPNGKTIIFETKDPPSQVADFYKAKLSPLRKVTDLDVGGTTRQLVFRNTKETVSAAITTDGTTTRCQLSVTGDAP